MDKKLFFLAILAAPDCVHQKMVQLFCTEFHFWGEVCNRFLCHTPLKAPSIASRLVMPATDSKMKNHSLHSVSRPGKVGHLFITRESKCPEDAAVN